MLRKNHFQTFANQQFITKTIDSEEQKPSQLQSINQDIFYQAYKIKQKMKNQSQKFRAKRTKTQLDYRYDHLRNTQTSHVSSSSIVQEKSQNEFLGLYSNASHLRLKNDQSRHLSLGVRTQCQKNNESALAAKMTIHCLRSNRRKLQEKVSLMQSRRRYTYNKIQKMKSQSKKLHNWSQKLKRLICNDKQQNEIIHQLSQQKQEELKSQRDKVRKEVLEQRAKKGHVVDSSIRHKSQIAKRIRQESQGLRQYKQKIQNKDFHIKIEKNIKQKELKFQTKQIRNKKAQNRKLQARQKFRNKWQSQFQLLTKTQDKVKQQQQIFTIQMQKATQILYSIDKQSI